jgi:hypothetical protein
MLTAWLSFLSMTLFYKPYVGLKVKLKLKFIPFHVEHREDWEVLIYFSMALKPAMDGSTTTCLPTIGLTTFRLLRV